jgi:hypothetical protein
MCRPTIFYRVTTNPYLQKKNLKNNLFTTYIFLYIFNHKLKLTMSKIIVITSLWLGWIVLTTVILKTVIAIPTGILHTIMYVKKNYI